MKRAIVGSHVMIALISIGMTFATALPIVTDSANAQDAAAQPASPAPGHPPAKTARSINDLVAALADLDPDARIRAIKTLSDLGPKADAAVPALVDALHDHEGQIGREARLALAQIGPAAVPALTTALSDDDEKVRWWAAQALEEIGPDAQAAIPALIATFGDAEHATANAPAALSSMGLAVVSPLLELLNDPQTAPHARAAAARALGGIGPRASVAVPRLIEAMHDRREPTKTDGGDVYYPVSFAAIGALGAIGPEAKEATAPLAEFLADPNPWVRSTAAEALGNIGPGAAAAVPALTVALRDTHEELPCRAAKALGAMGPAAREAIPEIVALLARLDGDINGARREIVIDALGEIGPLAVPALTIAYRRADAEHRSRFVLALGAIGTQATHVVPTLIAALEDSETSVRLAALAALCPGFPFALGADPHVEAAIPALGRALKDRVAEVRQHAALALFTIGPRAEATVPALIEALADRHADVRKEAAWALFAIGPPARAATKALSEATRDRDWAVRVAAAKALAGVQSTAAADAVDASQRLRERFRAEAGLRW
jgi:HEAT repeat protein